MGHLETMVYLPYITENSTFYAKDTENMKSLGKIIEKINNIPSPLAYCVISHI